MNRLERLLLVLSGFDLKSTGKWFILASLVGVAAGLGAIAFQYLSQAVTHQALAVTAGYEPEEPAGEHSWFADREVEGEPRFWLLLAVLVGGGLASGLLVFTFAPEARGHGTDGAIEAFHHRRGVIRGRIPIIKTLASAITIGTGGSGGREGPIAQIGAGFGSFLASRLNLPAHDRRILLAAGMAAGVGAIFRAPLAGALFAGEILYREADIESEVIVPSAISSIVAYTVFSLSLPHELRFTPLFGKLSFSLHSFWELLPLAVLAVALSMAGVLYIKVFYATERLFERLPMPAALRPALGALLTGLLAIALYHGFGGDARILSVLSTGYGSIQEAFRSAAGMGVGLLLAIALGKIVTTSLTIGSGGSGGVFGPSMVIGGCLGAAGGLVCHGLWPDVVTDPEAYVLLGMAGFFAGAAHAPISTVLMVFEMTGTYEMLLPTMWVSTLCFLLSRRWTLYHQQLPTRLESPAHRGSFIVDVLEGIHVGDVFDPGRSVRTVPESMELEQIVHLLGETEQDYFPVVDPEGRMVGVFSSTDVRRYLFDESIWHLAIAADIMISRFVSVTPEDDLNTALRRFTRRNIEEMPVLDPADPARLLGMLRRKELIAAYNQSLVEQKKVGDDD